MSSRKKNIADKNVFIKKNKQTHAIQNITFMNYVGIMHSLWKNRRNVEQ